MSTVGSGILVPKKKDKGTKDQGPSNRGAEERLRGEVYSSPKVRGFRSFKKAPSSRFFKPEGVGEAGRFRAEWLGRETDVGLPTVSEEWKEVLKTAVPKVHEETNIPTWIKGLGAATGAAGVVGIYKGLQRRRHDPSREGVKRAKSQIKGKTDAEKRAQRAAKQTKAYNETLRKAGIEPGAEAAPPGADKNVPAGATQVAPEGRPTPPPSQGVPETVGPTEAPKDRAAQVAQDAVKSGRGYSKEIVDRVVAFGKEGKSWKEVSQMEGMPKTKKTILKMWNKAGVTVPDAASVSAGPPPQIPDDVAAMGIEPDAYERARVEVEGMARDPVKVDYLLKEIGRANTPQDVDKVAVRNTQLFKKLQETDQNIIKKAADERRRALTGGETTKKWSTEVPEGGGGRQDIGRGFRQATRGVVGGGATDPSKTVIDLLRDLKIDEARKLATADWKNLPEEAKTNIRKEAFGAKVRQAHFEGNTPEVERLVAQRASSGKPAVEELAPDLQRIIKAERSKTPQELKTLKDLGIDFGKESRAAQTRLESELKTPGGIEPASKEIAPTAQPRVQIPAEVPGVLSEIPLEERLAAEGRKVPPALGTQGKSGEYKRLLDNWDFETARNRLKADRASGAVTSVEFDQIIKYSAAKKAESETHKREAGPSILDRGRSKAIGMQGTKFLPPRQTSEGRTKLGYFSYGDSPQSERGGIPVFKGTGGRSISSISSMSAADMGGGEAGWLSEENAEISKAETFTKQGYPVGQGPTVKPAEKNRIQHEREIAAAKRGKSVVPPTAEIAGGAPTSKMQRAFRGARNYLAALKKQDPALLTSKQITKEQKAQNVVRAYERRFITRPGFEVTGVPYVPPETGKLTSPQARRIASIPRKVPLVTGPTDIVPETPVMRQFAQETVKDKTIRPRRGRRILGQEASYGTQIGAIVDRHGRDFDNALDQYKRDIKEYRDLPRREQTATEQPVKPEQKPLLATRQQRVDYRRQRKLAARAPTTPPTDVYEAARAEVFGIQGLSESELGAKRETFDQFLKRTGQTREQIRQKTLTEQELRRTTGQTPSGGVSVRTTESGATFAREAQAPGTKPAFAGYEAIERGRMGRSDKRAWRNARNRAEAMLAEQEGTGSAWGSRRADRLGASAGEASVESWLRQTTASDVGVDQGARIHRAEVTVDIPSGTPEWSPETKGQKFTIGKGDLKIDLPVTSPGGGTDPAAPRRLEIPIAGVRVGDSSRQPLIPQAESEYLRVLKHQADIGKPLTEAERKPWRQALQTARGEARSAIRMGQRTPRTVRVELPGLPEGLQKVTIPKTSDEYMRTRRARSGGGNIQLDEPLEAPRPASMPDRGPAEGEPRAPRTKGRAARPDLIPSDYVSREPTTVEMTEIEKLMEGETIDKNISKDTGTQKPKGSATPGGIEPLKESEIGQQKKTEIRKSSSMGGRRMRGFGTATLAGIGVATIPAVAEAAEFEGSGAAFKEIGKTAGHIAAFTGAVKGAEYVGRKLGRVTRPRVAAAGRAVGSLGRAAAHPAVIGALVGEGAYQAIPHIAARARGGRALREPIRHHVTGDIVVPGPKKTYKVKGQEFPLGKLAPRTRFVKDATIEKRFQEYETKTPRGKAWKKISETKQFDVISKKLKRRAKKSKSTSFGTRLMLME